MGVLYVLVVFGVIFIFAGLFDFLVAKDRKGLREDREEYTKYLNYKD